MWVSRVREGQLEAFVQPLSCILFLRTRTLFPLSTIWPWLSRVILNVYFNTSQCLSCYIRQLHIVVVQSLSRVWLFASPWTAEFQAPLSSTISWSLLKFMSVESVMLSNHLVLCCLILLLPSIFPSIRVLSNELDLHNRWPKYWSYKLALAIYLYKD